MESKDNRWSNELNEILQKTLKEAYMIREPEILMSVSNCPIHIRDYLGYNVIALNEIDNDTIYIREKVSGEFEGIL